MGYKVPVGISNKHIHLSQADLEVLFGEGAQLTLKKELKQPNQFAAEEQVQIVGPKGSATVRVLGPTRKETQVELSMTDTRSLGIKGVPVRQSGKLEGTPGLKIVGPKGEVELDHGVIVAQR
ncbi:MAG: propanediol utilization protein, partial [Clostridia bacterium]|nr:propanediol utilization protein [Clostridia bacterium]